MYKYLFGPVPSRRLGMSLGVDLVPHKVCSLDCVYCECGETTKLTADRMEYILFDKVKGELEDYFINNPDPDFITFSGSGEPSLNIFIGDVLKFIKKLKPNVSVAVLTNGTLFSDKNVREELLLADVVLPSIDAATTNAFNKINRPSKDIDINEYIDGLIEFRKEFKGKIWLEIFILPGYNDDDENIVALASAIKKIMPDKVQLNTLDRPGTVDDIYPSTYEELKAISDKLGYENTEIISSVKERKNIQSYRNDIEAIILETIKRRPCTLADLTKITGVHINEINKYLGTLEEEAAIYTSKQKRGTFYHLSKQAN